MNSQEPPTEEAIGPRLVDAPTLEAGAVVANSAMNRERRLRGVNSYTRELGFDPLDVVMARLRPDGDHEVAWLDLCCGEGRALVEAAQEIERSRLTAQVAIVGVDLVEAFVPVDRPLPGLELVTASLTAWKPDRHFDLITCVHGLHYIGDKLGLLGRIASWLTSDGKFVADFDVAGMRLDGARSTQHGNRQMTAALRAAGFNYDARRHQIWLEGGRDVDLPFAFTGADPDAGPNYTGQPAVRSFYAAS